MNYQNKLNEQQLKGRHRPLLLHLFLSFIFLSHLPTFELYPLNPVLC